MLQPLDVEEKFVASLGAPDVDPANPATTGAVPAPATATATATAAPPAADGDHSNKKRRKLGPGAGSAGGAPLPKELTVDQKAIVKLNVTREATTEGFVKCVYCDKEITSKNVDRWASHLRGCLKTPEDVKAQIQPFRPTAAPTGAAATTTTTTTGTCPVPVAMTTAAAVVAGLSAAQAASSGQPLQPASHPAANTVHPQLPTTGVGAAASSAPLHVHSVGVPAVAGQLVGSTSAHLTGMSPPLTSGYNEVFKVHVSKDYMKFNAAHFIAYKGFREKLHGHNYRVAVTITGVIGQDGYVVDFGEIKKISRVICKDLNESFLVPMNSDALKITFDGTNVHIQTEDMAKFSFPKADCSLLPIVHSSAEELAIYISNQIVEAFTVVALMERGVRKLEVSISEAHQQMASYERSILP